MLSINILTKTWTTAKMPEQETRNPMTTKTLPLEVKKMLVFQNYDLALEIIFVVFFKRD